MKTLYIHILSWFLFHANRKPSKEFYEIKNRILKKYGKHICYDIQFIEGKKCWSCGGSGVHRHYSWSGNLVDIDACWYCHNGWYKRPVWNVLSRVKFGKYESFHQPFARLYEKPDYANTIIEGYIEKTPDRFSSFALTILFLTCEKGYLKRWYKGIFGWYVKWWSPKSWPNNIAYIIKFKKFPPLKHLKTKLQLKYYKHRNTIPMLNTDDDLPF